MEWSVYYYNTNKNEILTWNVFQHAAFRDEVQELLATPIDKEDFVAKLHSTILYYFWSKAEYEIIIEPWVGRKDCTPIKVDIYSQIYQNWDRFVEYLWQKKKEA